MIYEDGYWRYDDTIQVYDLVRHVVGEIGTSIPNTKEKKRVQSANTVAAVERLMRADRRHAIRVDDLDSDPWLLNTPAGTLDLRTGQLRAHDSADYITLQTPVAPDFDMDAPLWRGFLRKITNDDAELIDYLQRVVGYAMTGSVKEHALFFLHGGGGNGKSTFIDTITATVGAYHRTAPVEVFLQSNSDRHPTELAMLRGARIVTAVETEEGRAWAESKVKALTAGDPVAARFMRQDFFEFRPQFKLLIAGNHKPRLRNVDEAIRRRIQMIPFSVKLRGNGEIKDFGKQLAPELPGILAWAIDGAAIWNRRGLNPPKTVLEATEEYLTSEDALGTWINEECCRGAERHTGSTALFECWTKWCELTGERAGSQRRFSTALEERGFEKKRTSSGHSGFLGIAIKGRRDA